MSLRTCSSHHSVALELTDQKGSQGNVSGDFKVSFDKAGRAQGASDSDSDTCDEARGGC